MSKLLIDLYANGEVESAQKISRIIDDMRGCK